MLSSRSPKGDCCDNAAMESFFHMLKTELTNNRVLHTLKGDRGEILASVEVWCNRQRLHSALGYQAPEEYKSIW